MPALTIPSPTDTGPASSTNGLAHPNHPHRSESGSPDRPPVSPITPTASVAQLAPIDPTEPRTQVAPSLAAAFRQRPVPVPISESENPDAIALRSAISLLQLQREKSKQDLRTLEDLKSAAVSDPHRFVRLIQSQREHHSKLGADILTPTLSNISGSSLAGSNVVDGEPQLGDGRKDSASIESLGPRGDSAAQLPSIPQPQNIIRCPPVNWAKYHIAGEPLDRLHDEQRQYPNMREPPRTQYGTKVPPHALAAPYSPFTDGLGEAQPTQSRRASKKPPF
ncbi:uncharacterized protein BDR25DRAFT_63474 [Lindgomyces ingoldianus]|uniref:Uncharacterized protein n=1 Tax=Lindgomyces ingoldianus TaxID=673940 RepID=A0ACB6QKS3_9PLEO|nr:uncharacterized protein BDR25DRAFT_63474 [Lindgomyces ingoldianus]KAF2467538.1 hypothetical protein BDR25DRAFT_63474 [Lindgomyces ingoldianus]